MMRTTKRTLLPILGLALAVAGTAQSTTHPINGANLPTRASLLEIPSEAWSGLPNRTRLPEQVDLRRYMPPPGNQGRQNSCIAWSLAYGMLSYMQAAHEERSPVDADGRMDSTRTYSPAFPYNLTKVDFDTLDASCLGSNFDKVFSVMMEQGSCTWALMPYDPAPDGCFQQVPAPAAANARRGLLTGPLRVNPGNEDQLRFHLAQGTPVAFAMGIDTSFMYGGMRAARTGRPWSWQPDCPTPMSGSHAMLIVGYDQAQRTYLVMNSWGRGWGEGGYCRLGYEVIDCYATEAYIARYAPPHGDMAPIVPLQPLKEASSRDKVKARLRLGETASVAGIGLSLAQHDPQDAEVSLIVADNADQSAIERLDLQEDHPVCFFSGTELVTLEYRRTSRKNNVRRRRAHIVARIQHDGKDPSVERALAKAGLIRAARQRIR